MTTKTSILLPLLSESRIHVIRLTPGDDLRKSLQEYASFHNIQAGVIVTCVGSLVRYNLRFANKKDGTASEGHFEIVSLAGTLSRSALHLHLCVCDEKGTATGGHLLNDNLIYTTAEIAIAELPLLKFERVFDEESGYNELTVLRH